MTTIAYRDGVLASDSLTTQNQTRCGSAIKIWRVNGLLLGGCGELNVIAAFHSWVHAGMDPEKCPVDKECESACFIVRPDGELIEWACRPQPITLRDRFYAWGSGAEFALGAMEMGASAETAVDIAIRRDTNSGPPIRVLKH